MDEWLEALQNADNFEDWEHAAEQLDDLKDLGLWSVFATANSLMLLQY